MEIILPKDLKIYNIASTDHLRPAINNVLIEQDTDSTIKMTATDGHILCSVFLDAKFDSKEKVNFPLMLNAKWLEFAMKGCKEMHVNRYSGLTKQAVIRYNDNKFSFIHYQWGYTEIGRYSGVQYPDYQRVIPKEKQKHEIAFNADVMYRAAKAIPGYDIDKVHIKFNEKDGPIFIEFAEGTIKNECIFMPVRIK